MPLCNAKFWRTLAALAVLSVWTVSGLAQTTPPPSTPDIAAGERLDALFARLHATKDEAEGDAIVADIWKAWMRSGDADLDQIMERAVLVMGRVPPLALPLLDDIVARAPHWAEAWNKRATVLFMLGEYERSLSDIDKTLALEPRHFGALAGLGLIRMNQGESRQALAVFRRALAVNPFLKERFGIIPALEKETGDKPI